MIAIGASIIVVWHESYVRLLKVPALKTYKIGLNLS